MKYALWFSVLAFAGAAPALGANTPLPIVASTCVPAPSAGGAVLDNRGSVHHSGATVGTVTVNCAFEPALVAGHSNHELALTYRDSTGMNTSAAVTASVIQISLSTGTKTTIATVSSDNSPFTGIYTGKKQFIQTFNYAFNFYYLEISAKRTAASQTAAAYLAGIK